MTDHNVARKQGGKSLPPILLNYLLAVTSLHSAFAGNEVGQRPFPAGYWDI